MPITSTAVSNKYASGGQGQIDVYKLKLTGKEFSIVDSANAAAADQSDAVLSMQLLEDVKFDFNEDGTIKLAIGNVADDEVLTDFLETVRPASVLEASLPELTLDTGKKIGGNSSGDYYLVIAYSAKNQESTKVKTVAAIGQFAKTSGGWTQKSGEYSKPSVEFNGSPNTGSDLAIASGFFETTILSATAVTTAAPEIINGKSHWIKYVAVAA